MTSEELITTLGELADNVGACLYDLDEEEFTALHAVVERLAATLALLALETSMPVEEGNPS